uniref:Tudor domain-containing protein 6-like isoform X2 n=1 Tax=Petromyzon marinus TaxID=7757 RepID=A0AAJ7TIJ5_PETMA|nr:tudor domain-containing protein 6-like isoform X2 [Petromyzon marinus]
MSRYPCPLKCGYELDVLLSHAEPQSPDNPLLLRFWARLTRADIDANFRTIRKAVMMPLSWEPVGLSTPLAVGEPCIAWYSKEASWHRAKVLAHADSQQLQQGIVPNYLVFFIDLGLREVVQARFMREGRPEFFQIPPMMQCYALANVLPMSSCWSKLVLDYVESQRDTKMHGRVEGFLDDHTIVVNLELMATQLCQMRCARPVDSNVFQMIVNLKIVDDAKPETAQLPKLPTVSRAYPSASLGDLKQHFNAEQPPIIPPAGPKIQLAAGRHEMSAFYSTRMPVGTLQTVLVTHVISPDSFFCQLQSFRLDLQRLIQLMALRYLEADARGVQFPLPSNSPCAVLNTRTGQWYRGLVIHNSSPSEAVVHFVDLGTRACMPSKHLQPLLSEFFDLPVQAFRCAMVGAHATLQEGSRIWSTEEVLLLKSILLNSVFTAQVVSYNRIEKLYYVVLLDQNGESVFQKFSEMAATRPAMKATLPDRVVTVPSLPDTAATAIGHGSGAPSSVVALPPMALADVGVGAGRPIFTALKLRLQNFTHVYVENIVSPDEFWVRLTSKNGELQKLMVQMQKHFSLAGPREGLLDKAAVGMACCAMCPNNTFYRATVTGVISPREVQVHCVDYGISQFVEPKDIRALPPHFLELPACVVRCRLAGVAPPEVRHQGGNCTSTDRWSSMATWFFHSQVFNKHLAMIPRSNSADGYEVDLYSIGKSESSSIAKELIRGGLAVALSGHAELLKVSSAGVSDSMVAVSSPTGPNSDGANDHDSVVPQPQEVAPVPRPAVGVSITVVEPLMFVVGEMTDVIVTSIKSPWEFWCRLTSAERNVALLNRKLNEHYRNWKAPLPHLEAGVCVAHYAPEDQWYRVFIYEVVKGSRSMASVLILDDGREVQVSTRDLYPIVPQFLKLKMQAFKCSLYNCLEAHEEQRDQATEIFKSFTKEALAYGLNCTIIMLVERNKRDFFNLVDLHTPFQSASAQLVSRGLAKMLDPPRHLAESDCPLSFPYSTHGIKIGAEEGVIMTHAESPSRFWCQLTRNVDALKLFMVKLGKHCSHAYGRQTFDMERRLCFAQYVGDGQWHRALATQGPNPNEVNVSFIDYGNNEVVEKSKVLPLLPDAYCLAELPCQAIQCFLVDVSAPKEGFPDSVLSFFRDMVYSLDMKAVVLCREDFGQLGLELFHGSQRLNTTINQMLNPSLPPSRRLHQQQQRQLPEVIAQTGSARRDAVTYRAREQSHRPPVTSAPSHEPPERLMPVLGPAPAQGRHKPTKPADREPEQSAVHLGKGNGKHAASSKREQPEALPRRVSASDSPRMDQVVRKRSPDAMNTAGYGKAMHGQPSYSFRRQVRESENPSSQWQDKATTRGRNGRCVHSEGSSQADRTCSLTLGNVTPRNVVAHNVIPENVTPKYLESSVANVLGDTTLEGTKSCLPICHSTVNDGEGDATREKEQEAKAKILPKLEDLAASPMGDGQAGATLNVFVLHVVTPSRFYVQLVSDEQTIYGLAEELNDGSVSGGSLRPSDLKLGDLICAKYSADESWYRAVVRGFEPDDPLALVEFIDYGNTDRVGSDSMSELHPVFLRHPRQSIACSLAGVRPCVSVRGNKWTKEAAELFTETVHDLELRCEFLARAHGGNDALWEVNLTAESGTSIADTLVAKGMADTLMIATSGESRQERQEQLKEQQQEQKQQASETTSELECATTNSTHEDNHGVEMDGMLELGQQYEVYVSLARGLDNFWCQLKVLADEQLTSLMSVVATTGDEREVSLAMVEVGGLYLARYSEDNILYRARVLDVTAGRAKVMFIDYGNEEELDASCLRGVPPNVADAPPFAFPCFLRGSTGCIVPDEVTDAFVGACLEESRMLKVVAVVTTVADCCGHSAVYEVELYDEHGDSFSKKYLRGTFAQDPLQRQEQGPVVDLEHAESGQGETKEAPDKEKVPLFEKVRLKSSAEEVHADVEPRDGGNPEPVISTIKDYPAAPPLAIETLSVHCLSYNVELGEVCSPAAGTGEELLGDEEEEVIPPLCLEELVPGTPCTFRSRVEAVVLEGEYDATAAVVRHEDSDAKEEVHVPLVLRLGKDPNALPLHDSCCCSFGLAGTSEACQGGGEGHCQGADGQWVAAAAACEDGGSSQWIGGGEPVVDTGGRPPAAVEPGRADPPLDQLAQETQEPSHETEELDDCAAVADEEVVGGEECEYEEVEMTAASDDNNQNSAWTGGEGGEPHLLVPRNGREEGLPGHLVLASVGEQDCAIADGASVDIAGHAEASMPPHDSAIALLPASGSLALGDSERRMGRYVARRGFGKFAGTFARDLADKRVESVTLTARLRCLSGAAPALPLRASPCRLLGFGRGRVGAAYDPRSPADTVARGGLNAEMVHGNCALRLRLVKMYDGRGVTFQENTVPRRVNLQTLGSKQLCLASPPSTFPNKPLDENVKVISLSGSESHRIEADNSLTVEKSKAEQEKTTLPWNDPDTLRFEDMSDADLSEFDKEHWIQRPGTAGSGAAAQFVLVAQTDRAAAPVEEEVRERPSEYSSPPPTPPDNNESQAEHEALHEVLRRSEGVPWPVMEKGDCLYEGLESYEYFERHLLASMSSLSSDYLTESYLDIGVLALEDSDVEQWHESSEFLDGFPDDSGDDNELYFPAEVGSSVLSPLDSAGFDEEVAPTGRREGRHGKMAELNLSMDPSGDVANGETAGATSLHAAIAAAATAAGVEIAAEVSDGQGAAGVSEEGGARSSLRGEEDEIIAALVPESVAFNEEGEEEVGTILPGSLGLQSVLTAPLACGAVGGGTEEVSPPRCHGDASAVEAGGKWALAEAVVVATMGTPTIVVHSDSDDEEEASRS